MFRVARYINQTNLTEFFEKPILTKPALTTAASHISHIYFGRRNASKYFFQPTGSKNNRSLWESLRGICDSHRMLQGHQLTVEVLRQTYLDAQAKENDYRITLNDKISQTAILYIGLKYPEVNSDDILRAAENENAEVKQELQMACKL